MKEIVLLWFGILGIVFFFFVKRDPSFCIPLDGMEGGRCIKGLCSMWIDDGTYSGICVCGWKKAPYSDYIKEMPQSD